MPPKHDVAAKKGERTVVTSKGADADFYTVLDNNGNFVAKTYSRPEAQAIAALPELLEALRDLRESVTAAYKHGRIAAEPFVRAGNVLAKAEGGR